MYILHTYACEVCITSEGWSVCVLKGVTLKWTGCEGSCIKSGRGVVLSGGGELY